MFKKFKSLNYLIISFIFNMNRFAYFLELAADILLVSVVIPFHDRSIFLEKLYRYR